MTQEVLAGNSRSFTPPAWPHHRSKHQHADDEQEENEGNEQQDRSAQFIDHRDSPPVA